MKTTTIYRQGDVLLRRRSRLPKGASEVPHRGRIVLAEGEATGHAHTITAPPSEITELTTDEQRRFLRIVSTVTLVHQEHAAIAVAPGLYEIVRQREWSDLDEPVLVRD